MKCPRCQASFTATPDAAGTVVCTACGSRLRARLADPRPPAPAPPPPAPAPPAPPPPRPAAPPPPPPSPPPPREERPAAPDATPLLRQILDEVAALRSDQQRILGLLESFRAPAAAAPDEGGSGDGMEPLFAVPSGPSAAPALAAVRSRRRKTVLLFDDDARTRDEAMAALQAAEVPARAVDDGHAGIAAIAEERPDVIVLELAMGGSMAGKDVVNMIKATMEWVDIPIVLYTRLMIESQKEARQVHGADEVVRKGDGSAEALVARVIAVFRRP